MWKNVPSPDYFKLDAHAVLDYLRNVIGVKAKIGVYGRSLGGIATCYLARQVDMVIADRTFSNLYEVVESKFHGLCGKLLYQTLTNG
jgi:hypothetical protein